jgi:undecaprenyl diphosphate synthase
MLNKNTLPYHLALIMDGNRRWAKNHHLPSYAGHAFGAKSLKTTIEAALELGIREVTAYGLSTENRHRGEEELSHIFQLIDSFLKEEEPVMQKQGISLHTIGHIAALPLFLQERIAHTKEATAKGKKLRLILALNYGGRDEILRAVKKIALSEVREDQISESFFSSLLDTAPFKDPDLLIRTGGEYRLSNFLLWQLSYTELYTTPVLWPDFSKEELLLALEEYQRRDKRKGR